MSLISSSSSSINVVVVATTTASTTTTIIIIINHKICQVYKFKQAWVRSAEYFGVEFVQAKCHS